MDYKYKFQNHGNELIERVQEALGDRFHPEPRLTGVTFYGPWLIQEIEHLKEKSEKEYEVIANFIIMDLFKQLIDFEVGENGLNFSSEEYYQKVKERSIEMGYHDWLFEDSKVTKIYKE
jgi:hypothetical protein